MDEPKVVVLDPKEDCFSRVVVDSGRLGRVSVQELFKGITGDSFQYLITESFKVLDSSKRKFLKFLKN